MDVTPGEDVRDIAARRVVEAGGRVWGLPRQPLGVHTPLFTYARGEIVKHLSDGTPDENELKINYARGALAAMGARKVSDLSRGQLLQLLEQLRIPADEPAHRQIDAFTKARAAALEDAAGHVDAGLTTQQLFDCIEMLMGPQTINFLWPNSAHLYPFRLMQHYLTQIGIDFKTIRDGSPSLSIYIPGTAGLIRFRSIQSVRPEEAHRGPPECWVLDHSCDMLCPERARPWKVELERLNLKRPRPY